MICIYEPYASNYIHIEFDKAFLLSVYSIDKEIIYYGEKNHVNLLRQIKDIPEVDFRVVPIPDYDKITHKVRKITAEFKNLRKINKESGNAILIVTNGMPQTVFFSNFLMPGRRVYFVMHGRLAALTSERHYRPWNMQYYMKAALQRLDNNFRLILLGEPIKRNAIRIMPKLEKYIEVVDHPFLSKKSECVLQEDGNIDALRIGTIGAGTAEKGISLLNDVSEYIKKYRLNIEVFHIGKIDSEVSGTLNSDIHVPFHTSNMIPEKEYLSEVQKLDYILYLYDPESYRLTASGALFEALSLKKPILAISNDYFSYVLEKSNRKVGYLCSDIQELTDLLGDLPSADSEEYRVMQENTQALLACFSPEIIGEQLLNIIHKQ